MPRLEGSFAIFPTDDGLLVLVPDGAAQVYYFFNDASPAYVVTREMEGYLTLRPENPDGDTYHFSRTRNASTRPITTKVQ